MSGAPCTLAVEDLTHVRQHGISGEKLPQAFEAVEFHIPIEP